MKNKYAGLITVRITSSRLPQKALLPIRGTRLIEHVIDRAKMSLGKDGLSNVIVCTSTEKADDVLEKIAKERGVDCFRGSLTDKIDRWRGAAKKFGADYIVAIDGDDPFCDSEMIKDAIKQIEKESPDIVTADDPKYICGGFTHCISTKVLEKICEMKATDNTEMTKPYLIESGLFKVVLLKTDPVFINHDPQMRLTVDYPEDYEFFKKVFDELKMDKNTMPLRDIMKALKNRPDIVAINYFRQGDWANRQKETSKLEIKKTNNVKRN